MLPKLGLYNEDYSFLTKNEQILKQEIDKEATMYGKFINSRILNEKYTKKMRHNISLFPNNLLDIKDLSNEKNIEALNTRYEKILCDTNCTELDLKNEIQTNMSYHIVGSLLDDYYFGHHVAYLFKEFRLGNSYLADYLLIGKNSDGHHFVFVEFEAPYGNIALSDGTFGKTIRLGIAQIIKWKRYIEANFSSLTEEFRKYTNKTLSNEFCIYDSTRFFFVVIAGRRDFFNEELRANARNTYIENNIKITSYDHLLDNAKRLINTKNY